VLWARKLRGDRRLVLAKPRRPRDLHRQAAVYQRQNHSPQPLTPQPWPCLFAVPAPAQRCRPSCAPSARRPSRPRQAARRAESTTTSGSPGAAAAPRTRGRLLTSVQDRKAHLDRLRWTVLARRCAVARSHLRTSTLTHKCRLHSDRIRSDRLPGTLHCQQARCVAR